MLKDLPANAGDMGSIPGWEDPLEKETPVLLPGEARGQRSLAGYSPWDGKGPDRAEHTGSRGGRV